MRCSAWGNTWGSGAPSPNSFVHNPLWPAGLMHLDEVPSAAAQPYSEEADAQQGEQQQPHGTQQGGRGGEAQQPFGWLGGLLFGKRRGGDGGQARRRVDASTWREFEKDFTEV